MSFSKFLKELWNDQAEGEIVKGIFISLASSFFIFAVLYSVALHSIDEFMPKYGFFIFFSMLSYAFIVPAVKYVKSCREFPCMQGMMIGMTIGTIAGFLPGFFVGATNGMFYGSVFGMVIGITLGIWNGKCCGIMGVMEGMMAGFMGGLMGAMSSVMMLNDHLKAAGIVVFLVSAAILVGLKYMVYTESRVSKLQRRNINPSFTAVLSAVLTLLTILLMALGPRSFIFQ